MAGLESVVRPFQMIATMRAPLAANATIETEAASAQWGVAGKEPEQSDISKVGMGSGGTKWPDNKFPPDAPLDDEEAERKRKAEEAAKKKSNAGDRGPWIDYSKSYVCFDDDDRAPPYMAWEKKISGGVEQQIFKAVNIEEWSLRNGSHNTDGGAVPNLPKAKKVNNIWVREFSKVKFSGPIYDGEDEFARVRASGAKNPLRGFLFEFYVFSA